MAQAKGGKGNEPWYMSRRIWSAILTLLITVGVTIFPESYELILQIGGVLASTLGITSWVVPKK